MSRGDCPWVGFAKIPEPKHKAINMKITLNKTFTIAAWLGTAPLLSGQQPNFPKPPPLPKQAIDAMEQARRNAGIRSISKLEDFAKKVRSIRIDKETTDDLERKLGKPTSRVKMAWGESWVYRFIAPYDTANNEVVIGIVEFNSIGRVAKVSVMKDTEELYSQGISHFESQAQQSAVESRKAESAVRFVIPTVGQQPSDPVEGQVYFNTKVKAFLGWNGSAWIPLNGSSHGN